MSQEFSSANIWKALSCGWDFKGGAVTRAGLNCPSLTVASGHLNLPWYGWRQHGHYLPPRRTSHPPVSLSTLPVGQRKHHRILTSMADSYKRGHYTESRDQWRKHSQEKRKKKLLMAAFSSMIITRFQNGWRVVSGVKLPTSKPAHALFSWSWRLLALGENVPASSFWHCWLVVLHTHIISRFIYIILPAIGLSLMEGGNPFLQQWFSSQYANKNITVMRSEEALACSGLIKKRSNSPFNWLTGCYSFFCFVFLIRKTFQWSRPQVNWPRRMVLNTAPCAVQPWLSLICKMVHYHGSRSNKVMVRRLSARP